MRFSVIIPTYNCRDTIDRVLRSIQAQDFPRKDFEIICVDDKSTDGTTEKLKSFKKITLIALPKNRGNGPAKNIGVAKARGDIVFFVDDHMYLAPNVLKVLDGLFRKHTHISGICGSYKSYKKTDGNIIRDIRRRTIYAKYQKAKEVSIRHFSPFSITIGAMRRSLFTEKGFPEHFGKNGAEDVLLQILHLHTGQTFYFAPDVKGLHDHNLDGMQMVRKLFIEINGTEELIYDLSRKNLNIPYQYGFLSFPLTLICSILLIFVHRIFIPISIFLFLWELTLSAKCLTDHESTLWFRLKATFYVLAGEIVKGFYLPIYFIKRKHFTYNAVRRSLGHLLSWEFAKFSLWVSR